MPFAATGMELDTLILSEVSQKEKDKHHMISHIQHLIYGINEAFHRKENHGLGEKTCGCPTGGGGSGRDGDLRVIRHNLDLQGDPAE